jgi:hypothetical protein
LELALISEQDEEISRAAVRKEVAILPVSPRGCGSWKVAERDDCT